MNSREQFKYAALGMDTSTGSRFHVGQLAKECVSKLVQNPGLCPNQTIADVAEGHQLNPMQTSRLIESCNQSLAKPVLDSKRKTGRYRTASKPKVQALMNATGMGVDGMNSTIHPPGKPPRVGPSSGHRQVDRNGQSVKTAHLNSNTSLRDFASIMSQDSFLDYGEPPASMGSEYHPLFDADETKEASEMHHTEVAKLEGYNEFALERAEGELCGLQQEHPGLVASFTKTAQQHVRQGVPMLDIVQGCLALKPDKSTVGMLKLAVQRMESSFDIDSDSAKTWSDALDVLHDNAGTMQKHASGIGLPVSETLFSTDLNGRARIINGDSMVLKKLRTVEDNEMRQFGAIGRIRKLKSWSSPRSKGLKRIVSNVSGV